VSCSWRGGGGTPSQLAWRGARGGAAGAAAEADSPPSAPQKTRSSDARRAGARKQRAPRRAPGCAGARRAAGAARGKLTAPAAQLDARVGAIRAAAARGATTAAERTRAEERRVGMRADVARASASVPADPAPAPPIPAGVDDEELMVNHGCQECGQPGGTLFRFNPPPGCTKPAVVVCYGCAHRYSGLYKYCCKTDAKKDFKLSDQELDALRCAYTTNPRYGGCFVGAAPRIAACEPREAPCLTCRRSFAQRMLYFRADLKVRRHRQRLAARVRTCSLRRRSAHALRGRRRRPPSSRRRAASRATARSKRRERRSALPRPTRRFPSEPSAAGSCATAWRRCTAVRAPSRRLLRARTPLTHATSHRGDSPTSFGGYQARGAGDGARASLLHVRLR
jgi:hypothetical protein